MSFYSRLQFSREKNCYYFLKCLDRLPSSVTYDESQRLMLLFFSISGLDILDGLDNLSEDRKREICEWIYHLQLVPDGSETDDVDRWGFRGSSSSILKDGFPGPDFSKEYSFSHLSMTYVALATLLILGDDLSRVDVSAVMRGMKACQQKDGSFKGTLAEEKATDMRFVYSAAVVCHILKDWSGMDVPLATSFIMKSMSYDYGFGQRPFLESHGGFTFCAVAALSLMGSLDTVMSTRQMDGLRRWCIFRQHDGFQGRPNKNTDTCYAFWVGATLKIIDALHLTDSKESRSYVLNTQDSLGYGFGKDIGLRADLLHSYLGIAGLSLIGEDGLQPIDPRLNITLRAVEHLNDIHKEKERTVDAS